MRHDLTDAVRLVKQHVVHREQDKTGNLPGDAMPSQPSLHVTTRPRKPSGRARRKRLMQIPA